MIMMILITINSGRVNNGDQSDDNNLNIKC